MSIWHLDLFLSSQFIDIFHQFHLWSFVFSSSPPTFACWFIFFTYISLFLSPSLSIDLLSLLYYFSPSNIESHYINIDIGSRYVFISSASGTTRRKVTSFNFVLYNCIYLQGVWGQTSPGLTRHTQSKIFDALFVVLVVFVFSLVSPCIYWL